MTHAELDMKVRSLRAVGGVYEYVAYWVEKYNRPHCIGKEDENAERQAIVDDVPH